MKWCPCSSKTVTESFVNPEIDRAMHNSTIDKFNLQTLYNSVTVKKWSANNKQLIVDDASVNRSLLKRFVENLGKEIEEAANGLEAIETIVHTGVYDIIWMDLKMPKCDGITATRYLRKDLDYPGVIIALTGYVDDDTRRLCAEAGTTHFLPKPFSPELVADFTTRYSS